jgi:hypothetical protein
MRDDDYGLSRLMRFRLKLIKSLNENSRIAGITCGG